MKTYTAPSCPQFSSKAAQPFIDQMPEMHEQIEWEMNYLAASAAEALHECIARCVATLKQIEDGDGRCVDLSGAGASGPAASQIAKANAALAKLGGLISAARWSQVTS